MSDRADVILKGLNTGFWLILAVAMTGLYFWRSAEPSSVPLTRLDLVRSTSSAAPLTLASLQGKVALVNFWGTWCPPCRAELPHVAELYHKWHSNPSVVVVPVSCGAAADGDDTSGLRQETLAYLKTNEIHVPVFFDPGGKTRAAVRQAIGFRGYPTTILLDRAGMIRDHWVGYSPGVEAQMDAAIKSALE